MWAVIFKIDQQPTESTSLQVDCSLLLQLAACYSFRACVQDADMTYIQSRHLGLVKYLSNKQSDQSVGQHISTSPPAIFSGLAIFHESLCLAGEFGVQFTATRPVLSKPSFRSFTKELKDKLPSGNQTWRWKIPPFLDDVPSTTHWVVHPITGASMCSWIRSPGGFETGPGRSKLQKNWLINYQLWLPTLITRMVWLPTLIGSP